MSEENVEVVREAWAAFIERGIAGAEEYYAEECEVEAIPDAPDRETRVGREGLRERYRTFSEAWGDLVMEPTELIDAGDETVVAVVAMHGQGEGSGAVIDGLIVFVYELRDGMVIRDRPFTSKREALEAAGLSE
jgi:ketosteroid isomerase-like protein